MNTIVIKVSLFSCHETHPTSVRTFLSLLVDIGLCIEVKPSSAGGRGMFGESENSVHVVVRARGKDLTSCQRRLLSFVAIHRAAQ